MTRATYVHEATIESHPGSNVHAIGAAVTVELCGHWEHQPPCRWPHHTAAEEIRPGRVLTRTVVVAGIESQEAERRVRAALAAGSAPWVEGSWSMLAVARVPPRSDDIELAEQISPSGARRHMPGE